MNECSKSIYSERDCNYAEYWMRRVFSSLLYYRIYRNLYPNRPYYTPAAIKKIETLLNANSKVFEWGSGISTIWFAKLVKQVISVEHDRGWYEKGLLSLEKYHLNNVDLKYSPQTTMESLSLQNDWKHYGILTHAPIKKQFYNYMQTIDEYPDYFFDCIAIDGRERVGCLVHGISKLSEYGFIIFDDSHRPKYNECFRILKDMEIEKYDFGLIQTTIFYRK